MAGVEQMATVAPPFLEGPRTREERIPMSFDEFLTLPDYLHAEWVDGEAIIFMTTTEVHARVVFFLARLVADFADEFGLGKVLLAPFGMRLRPDGPYREPDVMFVAMNHGDRVARLGIQGPADLVIELVSEDSASRDRNDKFYEYQEGGIPEYWIYDTRPGRQRIDAYELGADGRYLAILPNEEDRYRSRVLPGFWIRLDWLMLDPLPTPKAALAEILATLPSASR
jgi:Uma2 family endonuclease